jgi:hypothetical protein
MRDHVYPALSTHINVAGFTTEQPGGGWSDLGTLGDMSYQPSETHCASFRVLVLSVAAASYLCNAQSRDAVALKACLNVLGQVPEAPGTICTPPLPPHADSGAGVSFHTPGRRPGRMRGWM